MKINTIKQNNEAEVKGKVIRRSDVAKELLHCEPRHTIIDIKPDKTDPDHKRSVFIFEDTERFQADFARICEERRKSRVDADIEKEVERRVKERLKEISADKE